MTDINGEFITEITLGAWLESKRVSEKLGVTPGSVGQWESSNKTW